MPFEDVTLATDTIHRPGEPRHFMSLTPARCRVRISLEGRVLADSTEAIRLMELGHTFYPDVFYFPPSGLQVLLSKTTKTSHCRLKGDCSYFSVGPGIAENIAWSYEDPLPFTDELRGLFAFDRDRVLIEEFPK